uniref:Uncharacterized protein n=1 Tax=Anguilla anguilla TaxID=7936 RepID=A0A0E9V0I5_ANGAN
MLTSVKLFVKLLCIRIFCFPNVFENVTTPSVTALCARVFLLVD